MSCVEFHCNDIAQKLRKLEGVSKATIEAYEPPFNSIIFWAISTWCTSKDHIFYVKLLFEGKKVSMKVKILKKMKF